MQKPTRRDAMALALTIAAPTVAVAVAVAVAVGADDDPIYAAIKRHVEAVRREVAHNDRIEELTEALPDAQRTWHASIWDDPATPAGCADALEWIAAQHEYLAMWRAHNEAVIALLTTAPTTLGGVAALLEYLGGPEFDDSHPDDPPLLFGEWDSTDDAVTDAVAAFPTHLAKALRALA